MMTSDKQREANRKNGQKGGHKPGYGKGNAHAVTHMLYCRHRLFPFEDKEAYRNFLLGWVVYLNPENATEADLAMQVAHDLWCKGRSEKAELESTLSAPTITAKNAQSLNAALLRARISRDISHTIGLLEKCRKLRREQEKPPDPEPEGKHPPLITYVILLDWEGAQDDAPCFPEGTPFNDAIAGHEQQALKQVRDAYKKRVQQMIPLETWQERYPVRSDVVVDAVLTEEDNADPQASCIEPETVEAREKREIFEEFQDMLKAVHSPGEIPLVYLFGRRQEPWLKFQYEPPPAFARRRGDFLPKLSCCYPIQYLVPEAYPQKLGSFRMFPRPEETFRRAPQKWPPEDPLDPDSGPETPQETS
jgi:hypothetical protein